ncbi:MAG: histidine kinase [Oscillospiraceae bacterium]
MQPKKTKTLGFKIVLYTILCVLVVGVFSNLYSFNYLSKIIFEKARKLDQLHLSTTENELSSRFAEMRDIGAFCVNRYDSVKAMKYTSLNTLDARQACIKAQRGIDDLLHGSSLSNYITVATLLNRHSLVVNTSLRVGGQLDYSTVIDAIKAWENGSFEQNSTFRIGKSLIAPYKTCFQALFHTSSPTTGGDLAYFYLELDTAIVTDILKTYEQENQIFLAQENNERIVPLSSEQLELAQMLHKNYDEGFATVSGNQYRVELRQIDQTQMTIYIASPIENAILTKQSLMLPLAGVFAMTLLVAVCVMILISHFLTLPVHRLIDRIQKIAQNDFSFDPSIERSQDEIGTIGMMVNQMSLSVDNLLHETQRAATEKKNAEISLLQAQVNPHFLYNTLDSIYWMSVTQKVPAISKMTKSLSNLLKNMAKGVSDKIFLQQELSLLQDYVNIQLVRFTETFEYECNVPERFFKYLIVKMTLQPLVENAIMHGIEESQTFGKVSIDASDDENYLYIHVKDSAGLLTSEQFEKLLKTQPKEEKALRGIGLGNVHRRLRLLYGEDCGLSMMGEKGLFTTITVKIRKEQSNV